MSLAASLGKKLSSVTKVLSATAMGNIKADTVIKGGRILNVNTGEIENGKDIAIKNGWIALVGKVDHTIGGNTEIIEAKGYILVPGFMDGHMHVESSMVTLSQFAKAVIPRGTTSIFMDPHEIANVAGIDGVKIMIDEGKTIPLRVYSTMPSCVPAAPGFEDAGAEFGTFEIKKAMEWENIAGLGEMMNFPGVLNGDSNVHDKLHLTLESGKVITGHYASPDIVMGLQGYTACGIASCHEGTTSEDALARIRLGMYAKIREGSAWQDVKQSIKAVTENNIDTRYVLLVTDDVHPHTLMEKGHLDHVLRKAIGEGLSPIKAIQMVTLNTAQCFYIDRFTGSISPGRLADIVFLKDLASVDVRKVIINGKLVAEDGKMLESIKDFSYPEKIKNSVIVKEKIRPEHFKIMAPAGYKTVNAHVIKITEAHVGTKHEIVNLTVNQGEVQTSIEDDIAKVMVIERHGGNGSYALGLVKGFGLKKGAVASTVAHDSHNLLILGTDDDDMALAANVLIKEGGGMVVVKDKKVLALLPLPIGGLMSEEPVEEVSKKVFELDKCWKELGCQLVSPFMTMALLSLPVLPEIRITNKGLVDTLKFELIDLIE